MKGPVVRGPSCARKDHVVSKTGKLRTNYVSENRALGTVLSFGLFGPFLGAMSC